MSWSRSPRLVAMAALTAVAMLVAGCESTGIRPLYASRGGTLQAELQAIAVDPIPDRLGHYIGDALKTNLNGTGSTVVPKYHLIVLPKERVQTALIDTVSQRAQSGTVITEINYRLVPIGGGAPLASGTVTSAANYDRTEQRFANIRAARDAEIRDAHIVADQITQQISAKLAVQ